MEVREMVRRLIVKMVLVSLSLVAIGGCPTEIGGGYTESYVREHCSLLTAEEVDALIALARVAKANGVTRGEALEEIAVGCLGSDACYECNRAVINYFYQH
jgi:ribosomal protein S24E